MTDIALKGNSGTIRTEEGALYTRNEKDPWSTLDSKLRSLGMDFKGDSLISVSPSGLRFSTDYGRTWELIPIDFSSQGNLQLINIINNDIYFRSFNILLILRNETGALDKVTIDTDDLLWAVEWHNGKLFLSTTDRELFVSDDNGTSWTSIALPEVIMDCCSIRDIISTDSTLIISANSNGSILLSTDEGESWQFSETQTRGNGFAKIENENLIFSTLFDFQFSPDNGYNWIEVVEGLPTRAFYADIDVSDDSVYLAGEGGVWRLPISSFYPKIQSFTGTNFSPGDLVGIEGANFSPLASYNSVSINGKDCEIISASTKRISFLVPDEAMSGQVMITVNGRQTLSEETLCINVRQASITESVDEQGFVILTSDQENGNIWLLNDLPIQGANQQVFIPKEEGVYSVQVEIGDCFSDPSDPYILACPDPHQAQVTETTDDQQNTTLSSDSEIGNQWFFNGDNIIGATSQSLLLTEEGSYTVQYQVGICLSEPSEPFVLACPDPYQAEISDALDEKGNVTLTSDSAIGNQWFFNGDSIIGATSQSLLLTEEGSYTVQYQVGICISEPSEPFVLACPDPFKAEISESTNDQRNITLTSDSDIGNQWFFNGDSIIGATSQSLLLGEEGSYTVQYQVGICLSEPSDPCDLIILSTGQDENFRIYPNPFQEKLFLRVQGIDLRSIRLHDVSGRSIKTKLVIGEHRIVIDASSAHPGICILSFTREGVEEQHKLVKR